MQIVRPALLAVEQIARDPSLLPSVDELRPVSCPGCGEASKPAGKPLGIVGHGTYTRWIRGLLEHPRALAVRIRRYFCRGCSRTISVLPDELHPRRWYAAAAILLTLALHYLDGSSQEDLRLRFDPSSADPRWSQPWRWGRDLLLGLWTGLAGQLGVSGKALDRQRIEERLRRLLRLHDIDPARRLEPQVTALVPRLSEGGLGAPSPKRSTQVASGS